MLHGVRRKAHIPTFDTRTLSRLQEVARHQLANPNAYADRAPKSDASGKYHATLTRPYDGFQQPTLTFWVAPFQRENGLIPDEFIVPDCFIYARCSPPGLPHDLLIQVKYSLTAYTAAGDIHILCVPTLDKPPH